MNENPHNKIGAFDIIDIKYGIILNQGNDGTNVITFLTFIYNGVEQEQGATNNDFLVIELENGQMELNHYPSGASNNTFYN